MQGEEECELGAPSSLYAFNIISGFVYLVPVVIMVPMLFYHMLKEYDRFPCLRQCLMAVFYFCIVLCAIAAFTQFFFSFYISIYVYGDFDRWMSNKTLCSEPVFYSSFVSLTVLYFLSLGVIFVLLFILVRKRIRDSIKSYPFYSFPTIFYEAFKLIH